MSNIKMSDVFDLPISSLMRDYLGNDLDNPDIGEGIAIAHAINSHDALIEKNKALRAALNDLLQGDDHEYLTKKALIRNARKALEQAK